MILQKVVSLVNLGTKRTNHMLGHERLRHKPVSFLGFHFVQGHLGLCKGVCSDESYLLQGYILGRTVSPDSLGFDVSALQQDLNHQLRSPRSSFSSSSQSSLADRAEANHIADLGREDLTKRRSNFQVKHAEQPLKVHITYVLGIN